MNYKIVVIVVSLFIMIISPAVSGMIVGENGEDKVFGEEGEKVGINTDTVELYITATGETVRLGLDEYVEGVMLAEVPSFYDHELLKAAAIAIRSSALRRVGQGYCPEHFSADLCDDYSHCMGYVSYDSAVERWGEGNADAYILPIEKAVNDTSGQVVFFENEIAEAVFHGMSVGCTESAKNAWGIDVPYLISVPTPEDKTVNVLEMDSEEFFEKLAKSGVNITIDGIAEEDLFVFEKNENGRTEYVNMGGKRISGKRFGEIFSLASNCFTVKKLENTIAFEISGRGHGVGLSLMGGNVFAGEGMKCEDILEHYYPGTEIVFLGKQ